MRIALWVVITGMVVMAAITGIAMRQWEQETIWKQKIVTLGGSLSVYKDSLLAYKDSLTSYQEELHQAINNVRYYKELDSCRVDNYDRIEAEQGQIEEEIERLQELVRERDYHFRAIRMELRFIRDRYNTEGAIDRLIEFCNRELGPLEEK